MRRSALLRGYNANTSSYVVQATSLASLAPVPSTSSLGPYRSHWPEPTVLMGIFPASVVHIRTDDGAGGDAVLAEAYMRALHLAEQKAALSEPELSIDGDGSLITGALGDAEDALKMSATSSWRTLRSLRMSTSLSRSRRAISGSGGKSPVPDEKEQPPIPMSTAGNFTIAGGRYPLVDEIASVVRDWYSVS